MEYNVTFRIDAVLDVDVVMKFSAPTRELAEAAAMLLGNRLGLTFLYIEDVQ